MMPFVVNRFVLLRNLAVLCMVGNMLYFLFPFPAIVWRLSFVLLSLYCVVEDGVKFGFSRVEKAIIAFVGVNLIYFFASYLWLTPSTTQIGNTLYALLAFVTFVFFGKKGILTSKFVTTVAVLLTLVAIPAFYNAQQIALSNLLAGGEDTTTNASVSFLMLLPLVFLVRNKVVSLGMFCVCLFFLVQGAKRGNIVGAVIPSMLYVWVLFRENKKSLFKTLLLMVAIVGIAIWAKNLVLGDDYLLRRYEDTLEGNTSGRTVIYATMWNMWYGSDSVMNLLFGYGYNGTLLYSPIHKFAHNDWLEILVDYGLFGFVCYIAIFIALVKLYFKHFKGTARYILLSIMAIWFFKTLYSMAFADESLALLAIPFGSLFIGIDEHEKSSLCD